jgi:hypothetical protein
MNPTPTEYAVYSAVVAALLDPKRESRLRPASARGDHLVIHRAVYLVTTGDPASLGLDAAASAARDDLIAKSFDRSDGAWTALRARLNAQLAVTGAYDLDDDDYLMRDADFFARYPDTAGILFLSRVGFDPTERTAMVHVTLRAMALSARSGFAILTRAGGAWNLHREILTGFA